MSDLQPTTPEEREKMRLSASVVTPERNPTYIETRLAEDVLRLLADLDRAEKERDGWRKRAEWADAERLRAEKERDEARESAVRWGHNAATAEASLTQAEEREAGMRRMLDRLARGPWSGPKSVLTETTQEGK